MLIKVIVRFLCRLLADGIILPLSSALCSLRQFKLTPLYTARLGHLALNTHLFVAARNLGSPEGTSSQIFFGANPVNRQLFQMWKREIPIIESRLLSAFYQFTSDILDRAECFWPLPEHFPRPNKKPLVQPFWSIDQAGPVLSFTPEEHRQGGDLLRQMGLSKDDWFICFHAADSAYREAINGTDERYHRVCKVETFLSAAVKIVELGGYAVRVGSVNSQPLPVDLNPKIIDYSTQFRSDFGDIYLLGNCRFFLGSPAGTLAVPPLFGIPVAIANRLPYAVDPLTRQSLFMPKLLKERSSGRLLHFREVFEYLGGREAFIMPPASFDRPETYINDRLNLVDNTDDEILDLTLDMLEQYANTLPDSSAIQLQAAYKRIFFNGLSDMTDHAPDIGPRFAIKYRALIE